MIFRILIILFVLLQTTFIYAEEWVEYEFTAVLDRYEGNVPFQLSNNDEINGTFKFDISNNKVVKISGRGIYETTPRLIVKTVISGHIFDVNNITNNAPILFNKNKNTSPLYDLIKIQADSNDYIESINVDNISFVFNFLDYTATALEGYTMPESIVLDKFTSSTLFVAGKYKGDNSKRPYWNIYYRLKTLRKLTQ